MSLSELGYELIQTHGSETTLDALRESLFRENRAGERCLLDDPLVRETALHLKAELIRAGHLSQHAVAIQAITFNKTESTSPPPRVSFRRSYLRKVASRSLNLISTHTP